MMSLYEFLSNTVNKKENMINSHNITNKIIMNDLSKKYIENVNIGECILTNNKENRIINIKKEKLQLYKIYQKYGNPYIISENSNLALITKSGIIINIPLLEYIKYVSDLNNYVVLNEENVKDISSNLNPQIDIKKNKEQENKKETGEINETKEKENNPEQEFYKNNNSFIEKKYIEELNDDFVKVNNNDTYIEINDKDTNINNVYYGYKKYVIFNNDLIKEQNYILEPYLFGYWYGTHISINFINSNSKNMIQINNVNQKNNILKSLCEYNLRLTQLYKPSDIYYINHNNIVDIIQLFINKYNLLTSYDIPIDYKYSSLENRLKIISGIIDALFEYKETENDKYYIYTYSPEKLYKKEVIENIMELANSLGVYSKLIENESNNQNELYLYVKCEKLIGEIIKIENIENKSEIIIEKLDINDYYELEFEKENQHYLLYDYTILSN